MVEGSTEHCCEQRRALRQVAALVWPVGLSSALNGSLCAIAGLGGEGLWRAAKKAVVDLGRQMGQFIKWVGGKLINRLI